MKSPTHTLQFVRVTPKQVLEEEEDLSFENISPKEIHRKEPKTRAESNFQSLQALKRSICASKDSSVLHESTNTRTIPELSADMSLTQKISAASMCKNGQNQINIVTGTQTPLSLSFFESEKEKQGVQAPPPGYDENKLYFKDPEIRKIAETSTKYKGLTWKSHDKQLEYFKALKESGLLSNKFYGLPGEAMDLRVSRITGVPVRSKPTIITDLNASHITLYDIKRELAHSNYSRRRRNLSLFDQNQSREEPSQYLNSIYLPQTMQTMTGGHRRIGSETKNFNPMSTQQFTSPVHNNSGFLPTNLFSAPKRF